MTTDHPHAIRARLVDVAGVCRALGLLEGYKPERSGRGLLVRCPAHGDRTPSCSVTLGPDGTMRVRCFGCDLAGDVFTLVAAARGLDVRRDFRTVLELAADLAGVRLDDDVRPPPIRPTVAIAPPAYPDGAADLWASCVPVTTDDASSTYLRRRRFDPDLVAHLDLARALPAGALPSWATFRRRPWSEAYRLVTACLDVHGKVRSLRATRTAPGDDGPKRVAPAGASSSKLVFANPVAAVALANPSAATDMPGYIVVEGEPDFWAASCAWRAWATIGIYAGSWSDELATRFAAGARVLVVTDEDQAGDGYASTAIASLSHCNVTRKRPTWARHRT